VGTREHLPSEVDVLGVPIHALRREQALERVDALIRSPEPALMAYVNAHTVNLAAGLWKYKGILQEADLLLRDGFGVGIAGRLQGRPFPANLNGTDFTPELLNLCAEMGWTVFILGGRPGVAARAAESLSDSIEGLKVVGSRDGMWAVSEERDVVTEVRESGADILLVALGNPGQEEFLARYLNDLGIRLGVGVGAFLDFTVGDFYRAPEVANRLGIEWVFRFLQEPRRLWRRYLVGNPLFLYRSIRCRMAMPKTH
jgi:exopolysaccharide biosynthesis WecB/TagA/CpsF family protein